MWTELADEDSLKFRFLFHMNAELSVIFEELRGFGGLVVVVVN